MPVTLRLTFPAGRYHATPWGRHVNEGVPEWPPSPWRLLRALVAVWRRNCRELPEAQVRRVLEALAQPPRFRLPLHRVAHTRHAMPMNVLPRNYKPSEVERKAGRFQGDPTIVFDTFVAIDRHDPVYFGWPESDLAPDDEGCLRRLASHLTFLGRAEGWVEVRLEDLPDGATWNCRPATAEDSGQELTSVFCPDPDTAFAGDHYPPRPDAKKLKKGLKPDEYLFDCPRWHLCLDTQILHDERWPRMPGARWVSYVRAVPKPIEPDRSPLRKPKQPAPTVARFLLDGPVLPPVTETVAVAEAFRSAVLGRFKQVVRRELNLPADATPRSHPELESPTLSGKRDGRMIRDSQAHAYYLPADEAGDGRLTHVTVFAEAGFSPDAIAALTSLRRLRVGEAVYRAQLVGLGAPRDFTARLFGPARVWESATPFVVTRHLKARGRKKDPPECHGPGGRDEFVRRVLDEEVRRRAEWWSASAAVPAATRLDGILAGGRQIRGLAFRRARQRKAGDDGYRRACGAFRLEFSEPVSGPICLGHLAHFGLGLFLPSEENG